jgi:hypothetical protein
MYRIEILHQNGKMKDRVTTFTSKRIEKILNIAKDALSKGDLVKIEQFEIEQTKDFCDIVLETLATM